MVWSETLSGTLPCRSVGVKDIKNITTGLLISTYFHVISLNAIFYEKSLWQSILIRHITACAGLLMGTEPPAKAVEAWALLNLITPAFRIKLSPGATVGLPLGLKYTFKAFVWLTHLATENTKSTGMKQL